MGGPTAEAPAVELRGIRRRFGRNRVLRGVDLTVEAGTSLLLVGPNGAGKTTLLRIIATLLRPSAGEGAVGGLSLGQDAERIRAATAYVSARGYVYDDLTGMENLQFVSRLFGAKTSDDDLADVLATFDLADAMHRIARTYSTGMRRRLSFAALCVRRVRLALIDEPYAGLDTRGIELVDRVVRGLLHGGTTVILASHQAGGATREVTRTLGLEGGRLVERDAQPPSERPE